MKNKTLLSTFLLFLFAVSTAWAAIGGSGTSSDPYTINSTDDWNTFASNVGNGTTYQDKYVKLTADITVETMVGTSSNPFKGTFNGAGHTLTINYDVTENVCAPFRYIDGATIKYLKVSGTIVNSGKQNASIVGYSYGNSNLIGCYSDVSITSDYNGDASNAGLLVHVDGGTVSIDNCAFIGKLLKKENSSNTPIKNGGLIGWTETNNNAKASISNSLFAPTELTMTGEQTIARARNTTSSLTIDNCYYKQTFGAAQGTLTSATDEDLLSLLGSGWEVKNGTVVPIMDAKNLTTATVSGIKDSYSYTGSAIDINYTVTALDGTTLTKGTHFTETISPATVKDKGEYTLTITGKGDYSGSQTFHFTVGPYIPDGLSVDNDYSYTEAGYYYVKIPSSGATTLTFNDASVTTFKVYEAGGKERGYGHNWDGVLVITVPEGYLIQLSGVVQAATNYNNKLRIDGILTVYDNNEASGSTLLENSELVYNNWSDARATISPAVISSGQNMAIRYQVESDYSRYTDLDLTVTLVPDDKYDITVPNGIDGGRVTSNLSRAKANDEVSLTVTPADGYMLNELTVTDADGGIVSVTDCSWYTDWSGTASKTATFKMPNKAVSVTATFTNKLSSVDDGLYVNMPHSGTKNVVIPDNITSFKLYDDGGKDGVFQSFSNGTLVVTAPSGKLLQISGTSFMSNNNSSESNYAIYNGTPDNSGEQMAYNDQQREVTLIPVISEGNTVYVRFTSTNTNLSEYNKDGLNLTVKVVTPDGYNISIDNGIEHGRISLEKTQAVNNETVNVTVTPDEGYVLEDVNVFDADGAITVTKPSADGHWGDAVYYTAVSGYSFKMRSSDATVTATFMPKTDFFVNMPKTEQRNFTISDGTTSFKVYDNSGKNGYYTLNDNGKLLLTAPEGYVMHVSGYVKLYKTSNDGDYLDIYDGNSTSATNLRHLKNGAHNAYYDDEGNYFDTPTTPVYVISSTNQILLHFVTDGSGYVSNNGGVYLTVTLKKSLTNSEISIAAIPDQTYTGSAICPVANVTDGETPLVLGTDYTVTCTNNISAGTAEMTVTGMGDYAGVDPITKSFKIVPKEISIAWGNQTSFVYNGTEQAPTAIAEGLVDGDECSITVSGAKDVGLHTATATKLNNDNYKLPTTGLEQNFEITKAPLTITAKNKTIAYGDEPANDGVEYTSFLGSDDASVLDGSLTYGYNYEKGNKTGEYTITPSGLTADNYEINFVNGMLTVETKKTTFAAIQVFEDENGKRAEIDGEYEGTDAVNITEDIKDVAVTFNREFTPNSGHATIMFPFDVKASSLTGVKSVIEFTGITKIDGNNAVGMGYVWCNATLGEQEELNKHPNCNGYSGELKAYTPYMIEMESATLGIKDAVTLKSNSGKIVGDAPVGNWVFRGTLQKKEWPKGTGIINEGRLWAFSAAERSGAKIGEFVQFGGNNWANPFRAYLVECKDTGNGLDCSDEDSETQPKASLVSRYRFADALAPTDTAATDEPLVMRQAAASETASLNSMDIVIVYGDKDSVGERPTVIGRMNPATGEIRMLPRTKQTYDLKGRRIGNGKKAKGAYYKK